MNNLTQLRRARKRNAINYVRHEVAMYGAVVAANRLGVDNAHIYRLLKRDILSPTLDNTLVMHGVIVPKIRRRRFACDIPQDFNEQQTAEFRRRMRTQAEYVAAMVRSSDKEK